MTRAEKVAEAQRLHAQGLAQREIAECLGAARSTVADYLSDPDLAKHRARRYANAGSCVDCGAPTDASRSVPSARCARCQKPITAEQARERWRQHRELVERLWAEGKTCREIQAITGRAVNITTARRAGYNLPYRRSPEQIARMLRPGGAERMAVARAARNGTV